MDSNVNKVKIIELTGEDTFTQWKFQLSIVLKRRNAYTVLTGEHVKPDPPAEDADETEDNNYFDALNTFEKADALAQEFIVTTIDVKQTDLILSCTSAKEMWDRLLAVYEQRSDASLSQLLHKFYDIKTKDPSDTMAAHIAKLESLKMRINQLGDNVTEMGLMTKILGTLPPSYNHFHSAWESVPISDRNMSNLTARLMKEELRQSERETREEKAFLSPKHNKPNEGLSNANTKGDKHKYQGKRKPGLCNYCKKPGHWKRDCRFRKQNEKTNDTPKGVNNEWSGNKEKGSAYVVQSAALTTYKSDIQMNMWYVDSGATMHMTGRLEWFTELNNLTEPIAVRIANGQIIYGTGIGIINIISRVNGEETENHLANVLYVPNLGKNLFSQGATLDRGLEMFSDRKYCYFKRGKRTVLVGVRDDTGLYRLDIDVIVAIEEANVSTVLTLREWHERLGHQNIEHVKRFLKRREITFREDSAEFTCDACMFGKQHRKPFASSETRAQRPGELIHTDICGPMEKTSLGGARYFLIFKDDFSSYRHVYFLKQKSDVSCIIKDYINLVETETGKKIKCIRSDNGSEYTSEYFRNVLMKFHIIHQRTVPYTPEQNGRAEREMRTIVESARSMIHGKGLDKSFWAEAVNTAVHILNRTGTSVVDNKSPYELWFGKEPGINHFHTFGSDVYVHIPKEKRKKWSKKSEKGLFMGYCENTKGFRIWIPEQKRLETSRDVEFADKPKYHYAQLDLNDVPLADENKTYENKEQDMPNQRDSDEQHGSTYFLRDRTKLRKPDRFGNEECNFIELLEPNSFREAVDCENSEKWMTAMNEEMDSLYQNKTWELVDLPSGKNTISNKWVFKTKRHADGSLDRFKARLVACGYSQKFGRDYQETFSPVVKFDSIRLLLSLAAQEKLLLRQFDVKTAFLYGILDEEIYMVQPEGFEDGSSKVCRLLRGLYGLKQSSRCWNQRFTKFLKTFQFHVSEADPCVFISYQDEKILILAIYIDDGLVAGSDEETIETLLKYLKREFEIKSGKLKHFIGLEIDCKEDGSIFVHQTGYVKKILKAFNMQDCSTVKVPMDPHASLMSDLDSDCNNGKQFPYREAVGSLMYLAIGTRPDISFALGELSKYLEKPTIMHWNAVKRLFRYLKGTSNYGILYSRSTSTNMQLIAYSDADFATDVETRKSTSGYLFMINNGAVAWSSRKQRHVALSTTEAEYIAGSEAVKQLIWLKLLMQEMTKVNEKPTIYMDNQSSIQLIKNPVFHKRTKHVDIRYHFVREHFQQNLFNLEYINTEDQLADIFTKALPFVKFNRMQLAMGMRRNNEF